MKIIIKLVVVMCIVWSSLAVSACRKLDTTTSSYLSSEAIAAGYYVSNNVDGAADGNYGSLGLPGIININSGSAFQPDGTVLASSVASFLTSANRSSYGQKQVLFRCDLSDKDELYEYYATNGDDNYAGRNEVIGIPNAYYSDYRYAAFRFTNLSTGEYYSRYWKARKLDPSEMFYDDNYVYVHAGLFSDVGVEVIKVSNSSTNYGLDYGRYTPPYTRVLGYIAFKGGGLSSGLTVGCDHGGGCYNGWYSYWPGGWGWQNQLTFVRGAYCEVTDYTPHIMFPTVSSEYLNNGQNVVENFSVGLKCETDAKSGTAVESSTSINTTSRPVSMGFLVNSSNAISKAQELGLSTTEGGLTYLLSNNYGDSDMAQGVGIRIYDSNNRAMQLLPSRLTNTGNSGGWYGYQELAQHAGTEVDHNIYRGNFSASLEKLPGETVTAGRVYGQVQIIVSFQ